MKELPIHIQLQTDNGKKLYEQIYEQIRQEIREGRLLKNEKLPSARFLSEHLQVSRTTVDMAYGQLVAEGYVEARAKSGYFVAAMEELYDLGSVVREPVRQQEQQAAEQCAYDFSPTRIDMSHFPYATWKKITKNILVDANSEMFSLGESQGDWDLRETICRYLHGSRGVNCVPEQIIIGAGNDFLLLLLEKILGRHIPVAMENPTYPRAYRIFESFAYPVSVISMDDSGMKMDELQESDAQIAYVMPTHQYPTGITMPIGRRMELLRWAAEKDDRYIIEDDYDSEFRYRGKPIPSLQSSDVNGKVVYIGTFSKAIAPAIRISYMVLPLGLLERYKQNCRFYASTVSRIDQRILNEFIKDGYFERYLNKMRKEYRTKHDQMMDSIKELEKQFVVTGENAGLHILLTDQMGRQEDELVALAEQSGVKVYGMNRFRMIQESSKATLILGYASLSTEEIREGIEVLTQVWKV